MSTVQFRTDEKTKAQSAAIFQQLGITMSDAINMFLRQAILRGGLPFEITLPKYNEATLTALIEMERSKGNDIRGKSVRDTLVDLKTEDDE